ncbi:unnamed protein product, partial [Discosporangium mesarthrocarpum]
MRDTFSYSTCHNGLQLFLARLLRPYWFQSIIRKGGERGNGAGSKRSRDGSVKKGKGGGVGLRPIEGLPEMLDLSPLQGPLNLLCKHMRKAFPRAVAKDLVADQLAEELRAATARTRAGLGGAGAGGRGAIGGTGAAGG